MKAKSLAAILVAGAAALLPSVRSQSPEEVEEVPAPPAAEEPAKAEEEPRDPARFLFETGVFVPQPVGADDRLGSRFRAGTLETLEMPYSTDPAGWARFGWRLPGEWGEIQATYWSQRIVEIFVETTPGDFDYGITEVIDFAPGIADDGFADGIGAETGIKTREIRLDWRFPLAERPRVRLTGFTGYRELRHDRRKDVSYTALDPGFPSLIRPDGTFAANLVPVPDRAQSVSRFSGRGLEVGIELVVPMYRDRVQFEAGGAWALLRGDAEASSTSRTSIYLFDDGQTTRNLTFAELLNTLRAPNGLNVVRQQSFTFAFSDANRSSNANAFDIYLGIRARIWRGLEIAAGFRSIRYDDVVLDLVPGTPSLSPNGVYVVTQVGERRRSIGYEGFHGVVAYRF